MAFLTREDLDPFVTIEAVKAEAMIADAEAQAAMAAPCLSEPGQLTDAQRAAVLAILRRAVIRWDETGTGVVTQQSAGVFSQSIDTTRSAPRGLFWPSEIAALQDICKAAAGATKAPVFTITTGGRVGVIHSPICDLKFGGESCSCGTSIAGFPIYEPY